MDTHQGLHMTSSNLSAIYDSNSISYGKLVDHNGQTYQISAKYSESESYWYFGVFACSDSCMGAHIEHLDDDPRTFMSAAKLLEQFDGTTKGKGTTVSLESWVMTIVDSTPFWSVLYCITHESPRVQGFYKSEKNAIEALTTLDKNHHYYDRKDEKFTLELNIFNDVN